MTSFKPRSASFGRRLFWVVALAVTALGGAYLGLHSGGGSGIEADPNDIARNDNLGSMNSSTALGAGIHSDGVADLADVGESVRRSGFAGLSEEQLARLLPRGITDVEGMGGKGFRRQVKSGGIWFPVFDVSKARQGDGASGEYDPSEVSLAEIPLAITSSQPVPGSVGVAYQHGFTAVGGTPPYRWSARGLDGSGFALDESSGHLSGQTDQPLTLNLAVQVNDAAGGSASTSALLAITPSEPLQLITFNLPVGTLGEAYSAPLAAAGGIAPYHWQISGGGSVWTCDSATGVITGNPVEAGETELTITVEDQQKTTAEARLTVKVTEGLEIITEAPLPPAAPGVAYQFVIEAAGGTPPYQWSAESMPQGWGIGADGMLSGMAPKVESTQRISITAKDSDGRSYTKPYDLIVRQGLIAVPSDAKVGLAWQPTTIVRTLGVPVVGFSVFRRAGGAEVEVYRGTGNNCVDHGLITGAVYDYSLIAWAVDGRALTYAAAQVTLLPMGSSRGRTGSVADPFVDRVRRYTPLSPSAYGAGGVPSNVTGPPDGRDTFTPAYRPTEVASLNASIRGGGSIVLEFTDNIIESAPGPDFTVFENVIFEGGDPNKRFMEPAIVEVALFEGEWYRFPVHVSAPVEGAPNLANPAYYLQGFAGVNATTGEDPTDPNRSGGDSFDLDALRVPDLTWVRFIRLTSTGDRVRLDDHGIPIEHTAANNALSGTGSSGFDLDAAAAVHP